MRTAVILSAVLVLPLVGLEVVNHGLFNANFPLPLFVILWLLPCIILLILMPIVRQLRMGGLVPRDAIVVVFKGALLVSLASVWLLIVVDQMPCFLGVPNCD